MKGNRMATTRKHLVIFVATVIAALILIAFAQSGEETNNTSPTTTPTPANAADQSDAIYTSEQATAGEEVVAQVCSLCHGATLQGGVGPALVGATFSKDWEQGDKTVDDLYSFISTNMPQNAPGSLTSQQYIDVVAYILQQNHWPAGTKALTADDKALSAIKLIAPTAP